MILRFNNLGVIEHAEIDLSKPFIVFTGPNGTGKTYLSYVLDELPVEFGGILLTLCRDDESGELRAMFDPSIFDTKSIYGGMLKPEPLYNLLKEVVKRASGQILSILNIQLDNAENFSIEVVSSLEEWTQELKDLKLNCGFFLQLEKDPGTLKYSVKAIQGYRERVDNKADDAFFEMALFFESIFFAGASDSTMFTAERTGIALFSKEISLGRLQNTQPSYPRYPRAIAKGMIASEDRSNASRHVTEFGDLADAIEELIIKGKIIVTPEGDLHLAEDGNEYELASSSSTVKALAELVFYVRHKARKMARVVIDEPEIHLHPDNQLVITRVFARMVNRGLQLIISTHSDYIIRELNNLIMLKSVGKKFLPKASNLGYKYKEEFLDASDVQPYLFRWQENGRVVTEPIPVESDGFAVKTIDDTIAGLNDSAQEIYYAMIDNK